MTGPSLNRQAVADWSTIQRAARLAAQLSPTARGALTVRWMVDGRRCLHPAAATARTRAALVRQGIVKDAADPGEPDDMLTDFGLLVRSAMVKGAAAFLAEHMPAECPTHGDDHTVDITDMLTCRECKLCGFPDIQGGQAYCRWCGEPMVCDDCGTSWGAR